MLTTLTLVIFQSGSIQIIVLPSNDVRRKPFQSALSRIHSKHSGFTLRQCPRDAAGEVFSVESFGEVAGARLTFSSIASRAAPWRSMLFSNMRHRRWMAPSPAGSAPKRCRGRGLRCRRLWQDNRCADVQRCPAGRRCRRRSPRWRRRGLRSSCRWPV